MSDRTRPAFRRWTALAAVATAVAGVAVGPGAPAVADTTRDRSWQLTALGVPRAQQVTRGAGIVVGVVDTGVDPTHPDLRGNVLPGVDAWDVDSGTNGWRDRVGHGTAMASLVVGHGHGTGGRDGVLGVAPAAKVLPVNVQPPGAVIRPDDIAAGIRYAVRRGAFVVCVALSSTSSQAIVAAVEEARARGVLVVSGSGNAPTDAAIGSPANVQRAVAVTSLDRNGRVAANAVTGPAADIAAPGVQIPVARPGGGYAVVDGSSTAAALVAGAVALIRSRYPGEPANLTEQRLVWTTDDVGDQGRDEKYGWGSLDLVAALTTPPRDRSRPPSSAPATTPAAQDEGVRPLVVAGVAVVAVLVLAGIAVLVALLLRRRRRRGFPADRG